MIKPGLKAARFFMCNKLIVAMSAALLCLFASAIALAQTIPSDYKKAVTFIFLADANGNLRLDGQGHPVPYGTGFFVGVKSDDGKSISGYLVTAKHVLHDEHGGDLQRVFVRLNTRNGESEFDAVDLLQNGKSAVYTDPDPSVDIAVVPALPPQDKFDFKVIPDEMISTKQIFDTYNVSEGTEVFFIGLFVTYYGEHKNNPIIRFGRVSMFPDDRIDWGQPPKKTEIYLIEAQSYGGNSGSPVFFALGSDRMKNAGMVVGPPLFMLGGVMSGRFNDISPQIGYVQSPTNLSPVTIPNIGIAAVSPAYLLHNILFSDELKKFRADHPFVPPPQPTNSPQPQPSDTPLPQPLDTPSK